MLFQKLCKEKAGKAALLLESFLVACVTMRALMEDLGSLCYEMGVQCICDNRFHDAVHDLLV